MEKGPVSVPWFGNIHKNKQEIKKRVSWFLNSYASDESKITYADLYYFLRIL